MQNKSRPSTIANEYFKF